MVLVCGLRSLVFGLRSSVFGLRSKKHQKQSTKNKVPRTKYQDQSTKTKALRSVIGRDHLFNQRMTRPTPAPGAARSGDLCNCGQPFLRNFHFNYALRNAKTSTDKCIISIPLISRSIAVILNSEQECVTSQLRAVGIQKWKRIRT